MPRDSQRSKLYAAERSFFSSSTYRELHTDPWRHTPSEVEARWRQLLESSWFRRKYGYYYVRLEFIGQRHSGSSGGGSHGWVSLPSDVNRGKWCWADWYLLHELAHNITTNDHGDTVAAHGPEFMAIYLELLGHWLGRDVVKEFKVTLRQHKVRYTRPRKKRHLSEEQRKEIGERLRKAREAKSQEAAA